MPWKEVSTMSQREEFVRLAGQPGANRAQLCRRFGISPKTGYKWLARYAQGGVAALVDRSRQPHHSPGRTALALEEQLLGLRDQHPAWGARKLLSRLRKLHPVPPGDWPAPSTVQAILKRHGRIEPAQSQQHQAFIRFEHPYPNSFWQMDFKGHVPMTCGDRCHPLTVLDDHSRYVVCLKACANERGDTVRQALSEVFERYGLPDRIGVDNGAPWGDTFDSPYTPLTVWLIQLGIRVSHSRPYHPQTLGKDERFHRTLNDELLRRCALADLPRAQHHFDFWRQCYNLERPHESLQMQPPISRYRPSQRAYPAHLPPVEYDSTDSVRRVQQAGQFNYCGRVFKVSKAFHGQKVAIRPDPEQDGRFRVFFCHQQIASIDLDLAD